MVDLRSGTGKLLRLLFKAIGQHHDEFEATYDLSDLAYQPAADLIRNGLLQKKPFAVSRFGYSELRAVLTYLHINEHSPYIRKLFAFARGRKVEPWWDQQTIKIITYNAGVFPIDTEVVERYCRLALADLPVFDALGSWLGGERIIKPLMPDCKFIRFHDFYHFLHERPWTSALEGQRVLVIHPFAKSIENQYARRKFIYHAPHTLPDFELNTYQAIQSIAGNQPTGYATWFDALEKMKNDISALAFDVAIIGCGAYGMPLAAFIKREMQKKAIHLGGNTQILFGIKGSRWENDPEFAPIFNEHWVRPLPQETPQGHQNIDSNSYW